MNYKETLDLLYNCLPMYQKIGSIAHTNKLDNIKLLCDLLGNPQNNLKSVHIAGTNGKGSSVAILSALLTAKGLKVGCYTSPHLFDFRERIRVGEVLITKEAILTFVKKILHSIKENNFSFFEITVAMAFWYFESEKVDIAIIETGLGGRLDSTNIINPVLTLITSIGLDHQNMLGDTLDKIAFEKAGIIKHKVPCILNKNDKCVNDVIERQALEKKSHLYYSSSFCSISEDDNGLIKIDCTEDETINRHAVKDIYPLYTQFPLRGEHQLENLKGVLLAYHLLFNHNIVNKKDIIKGFNLLKKNTFALLGRCQTISAVPRIICDVSHNYDGIKALFKWVGKMQYNKLYCMLAFSKDKSIDDFFSLLPKNAKYYLPNTKQPRLLHSKKLYKKLKENDFSVYETNSTVKDSFETVKREISKKEDLFIIFGSFFLIEELHERIILSLNSG